MVLVLVCAGCGRESSRSVSESLGGSAQEPPKTAASFVRKVAAHEKAAWGLARSAAGDVVASAGNDEAVKVWNGETYATSSTLALRLGQIWGFDISPDGRHLVASGRTLNKVRLAALTDGATLAEVGDFRKPVRTVGFSPDGAFFVSGGTDGALGVFTVPAGRKVAAREAHRSGVWCAAYSPDGKVLASGGMDGVLKLWDATTLEPLAEMKERHDGIVRDVRFTGDGALLVSCGKDNTVCVWDAKTGALVRRMDKPYLGMYGGTKGTHEYYSVLPDAGTGRVAAGGAWGNIYLFDLNTGKALGLLEGHGGPVLRLISSADGGRMLSCAADGSIRVWDTTK